METMAQKNIAYCGLVCDLCRDDCRCKEKNQCHNQGSDSCFQYRCCLEKHLNGCWECDIFPCDQGMYKDENTRLIAFVEFIRTYGLETLYNAVHHNLKKGILYHRNGFKGDYDGLSQKEIFNLLKKPDD